MDSMTRPQLPEHPPAPAFAERRAHSREPAAREHFAPLWLRAGLIVATLGTLALLYPRHYVESTLQHTAAPNAATLAYLELWVRSQPEATDTRVLLARQALKAGRIRLARRALAPWAQWPLAALPLEVARQRLHLLRTELARQRPASGSHRRLAAAYTRDVLRLARRTDVRQVLREAQVVATLGHYRAAAQLYQLVIAQTRDPALRLAAFYDGIAALRAAGRSRAALTFARHALSVVPRTVALWRELTRLALMADAPQLAARYARRLIGLEPP
jgi:tetratricopeptide (TPR) repeat protein